MQSSKRIYASRERPSNKMQILRGRSRDHQQNSRSIGQQGN